MSKGALKEIKEWIISIIIAAIIAFTIKGFLFDIIQVSGTSMVPTLHNNDRVAIEKISLYRNKLKHGEIVILDPGKKGRGIYIKRVIGLPGDKLDIKDGRVFINDKEINEPYLKPGTYTDGNISLVIPADSVYVLGDNREVSEDSRYIGPIPIDHLKGHALFRVFPFNQMHKL